VFIGEQNCGTLPDISHLAKQKRADTVFYCNFAQVKNQTTARILYVTGSHEVRLHGTFQ